MALFFFVVGIDIKKEFVYGSLASVRQALLPCLGATGGMVVPMAVYALLNATGAIGASSAGWAVPMVRNTAPSLRLCVSPTPHIRFSPPFCVFLSFPVFPAPDAGALAAGRDPFNTACGDADLRLELT